MQVSKREEALARELYEQDMLTVSEDTFVPWNRQIEPVLHSYRKQASRIVKTKWFAAQIEAAKALRPSEV